MAKHYRLIFLPAELLIEVMKYMPDLAALSRLFTACPKETKPTFMEYRKEIISSVLDNMSPELRNAAFDVLVTRRCSPIMRPRDMTLHIQNRLDAREYDRLRLSDYLPFELLDLIRISGSIESLTDSFARDRILRPCEQQQHSMPLSPVELHRIRRSLWRFQLCYEMCHPRNAIPPRQSNDQKPKSTRQFVHYQPRQPITHILPNWLQSRGEAFRPETLSRFLPNLALWEQAELEAIQFHLVQEVNRIQYLRSLRSYHPEYNQLHGQPFLLRRLIRDIDRWDPNNPTDHVLVTPFHQSLHVPHYPIVWDRRREFYNASTPNTRRQVPIRGLQGGQTPQWGWCLWDEARLLRRGLIDFQLEEMYERKEGSLKTKMCQRLERIGRAHAECIGSQYDEVERWIRARFELMRGISPKG